MERSSWFFRLFFLIFACIATCAFEVATSPANDFQIALLKGIGLGFLIFGAMAALEIGIGKMSLRKFNTALLGLFVGSLIGFVVTQSARTLFGFVGFAGQAEQFLSLTCYLVSIYLGIMLTSSSQDAWWLSIPFVRLAPANQTMKKEIVIDTSAIEDPRLIELARSGLLDHQLVVPTFIVKDIQKASESPDENSRMRNRKCLEHLKRLESMPHLGLSIKEFHFSETEDLATRLSRAAKLIQAYVLISHEQSAIRTEEDAPTTISIETIAAALKPGAQRGEILTIKIQRLGKEPKQGVGYLEDSTMVVVNGGGEFLGQTIRTQVLSQKYSSSGKIVFCNALTQDEKGNLKPNGNVAEGSPYHLSYQ